MLDTIKKFGSTFLQGKLTYTVAVVGLIGSVALWLQGFIDNETFLLSMNANFIALGLRRAIEE